MGGGGRKPHCAPAVALTSTRDAPPPPPPQGDLAAKVSALHLVSNEDGFVATVQSMPTLRRDRAGRVVGGGGAPYAVVHQYDRSALLKRQYEGEYVWLAEGELTGK